MPWIEIGPMPWTDRRRLDDPPIGPMPWIDLLLSLRGFSRCLQLLPRNSLLGVRSDRGDVVETEFDMQGSSRCYDCGLEDQSVALDCLLDYHRLVASMPLVEVAPNQSDRVSQCL